MLTIIDKINLDKYLDGKKVVLYGAGNYGVDIAGILKNLGVSIYAFTDSNSEKWGKQAVDDINIISPHQLENGEEYLIIVSVFIESVRAEIVKYLLELNVEGELFSGDLFQALDVSIYYNSISGKMVWGNRYAYYQSVPWHFHKAYDRYPSKSYVENVFHGCQRVFVDNYYTCLDCSSKYFNIKNGMRMTTDVPDGANRKIVFFGDSRIMGYGVEDSQTIPSCLQRLLNKNFPDTYRCLNYSDGAYNLTTILNRIKTIDLQEGDIVLCQLTAIRGYETNTLLPNGLLQWYVQEIANYCKNRDVEIAFLFLGTQLPVTLVNNKSDAERFICELFENKWIDRRVIDDSYCKRIEDFSYWKMLFVTKGINCIDCMEVLKTAQPHDNISYFLDEVHLGSYGTQLIAKELYAALNEQAIIGVEENYNRMHEQLTLNDLVYVHPFAFDDGFKKYIDYLKEYIDTDAQMCGAIVMNANPFTRGHQYLVESAAKQVDKLYLFVVEENRSNIQFADRFAMVQEGVKEYDNVVVLKSGEYIISQRTFPEYFVKKDIVPNCALDIGTFGNFVAPTLNIVKRFVGTEPYSFVTNSYNEQMKDILPMYGIELIEIPRMAIEDDIISATKVRNAIENSDTEFIEKALPLSTLQYMKEHQLF